MIIGNCDTCKGTASVPHAGNGETVTCFSCNGFGKRNERTFSAYKSQELANRYGKRNCSTCKGSGLYTFPIETSCSRCHDNPGKSVISASVGDILPDNMGRCGYVNGVDIQGMRYVVIKSAKPLNFGESYLGLNALMTCTDYGSVWKDTDENSLIECAKDEVSRSQWTKIIDKDRRVVPAIAVVVTPNGYSIKAFDGLHYLTSSAALPPTYTDTVLSAPAR